MTLFEKQRKLLALKQISSPSIKLSIRIPHYTPPYKINNEHSSSTQSKEDQFPHSIHMSNFLKSIIRSCEVWTHFDTLTLENYSIYIWEMESGWPLLSPRGSSNILRFCLQGSTPWICFVSIYTRPAEVSTVFRLFFSLKTKVEF